MLVIEVDVIGAQTLERSLDCCPDVVWGAVEFRGATVAVGDHPELGGEDDFVAVIRDRPSDELFVYVGPVALYCIDQGDTKVEGATDRANRLGVMRACLSLS